MAIKELFYDHRPVALLNPRASQRIDPRFKFTRTGSATYFDREGILRTATANVPRFDHDAQSKEFIGLLIEKQTKNIFKNHSTFSGQSCDSATSTNLWRLENLTMTLNAAIAPDGTNTAARIVRTTNGGGNFISNPAGYPAEFGVGVWNYRCISLFVKAGAGTSSVEFRFGGGFDYGYTFAIGPNDPEQVFTFGYSVKLPNDWFRLVLSKRTTAGGTMLLRIPDTAGATAYVWGPQGEIAERASSYIYAPTISATRPPDLLAAESSLPSTGSVYIDARAITVAETDTLISLKNTSNEKINLSYESNAVTYNSLALIASYKGTSKSSLPLPVPTTNRERNIITWGANNYQYTTDSSRYATSLSSSVPANLTQLSIGHDAVDPTKAVNGYINAVYLYNGEITPAVAEALVRGELDPINADTYSPVGPTGSLALVINTQGATSSGDKTFTLPAESALNDNDIVITWGDGTESGLDGASAELGAPGLTHTYPSAGIYPVWVEGQLENLQFNNSAYAPDLLEIAAWGTSADSNDVFLSPSTMNSAFYGCSQMNFSSSARTTTNLPDTSAVTNWYRAFKGCISITGTFPAFNLSAATTLQEAWQGCNSMTSFIAAGDQTQNVINFGSAWYGCSSLTSFPLINTAAGTNFGSAWYGCSSLTSFPLINTSSGTNFSSAWQNCSALTSFPLINTAAGTNFGSAWYGCSSLTSFPLINTAAGTTFAAAWAGCSGLTSFPLIDTAAGTNFGSAWQGCSSLTSFPLINTAAGTNFSSAWNSCSSLTSFPLINTAAGTNFSSAWNSCSSLTSFPLINTAAGTNFSSAWNSCSSLTSFPLINTAAGTNFFQAWYNCSSLTSFPANFFDSWSPASVTNQCFYLTWDSCSSLTPASVVNILNSIAASGVSAPSGTGTHDKKITIDWDGTGTPATTAAAAITTLKSRNWEIYLNDVLQ